MRLITAVALQVAAIWTDRRYLDMSLLNSGRRRWPAPKPREVREELHRETVLHTNRDLINVIGAAMLGMVLFNAGALVGGPDRFEESRRGMVEKIESSEGSTPGLFGEP